MTASKRNLIGYVLQMYPVLTETFVYREVVALREQGHRVNTYSFRTPDPERLSRESRHLMDETVYVLPLVWLRFVGAHLSFALTRPLRYFGTLFFVLTRRGETARNRLLTFFHFLAAVDLARVMRRDGVTHVHAHFTINAATLALVISRILDIPFSFTAHNLMFRTPLLLRPKLREACFVVAISEYTRSFLVEALPGEPSPTIHIVHCGVSLVDFAPPQPRPSNDVPRIVFVAQLEPRKGAPVLIEACRILASRGIAFHCRILGDGPERPRIEELIAKHGLGASVELAGTVLQEQLRAHLDAADVFALPCVRAENGDMDGVPVSMMEAMAMEIAPVSTRLSGIPDLVEHESCGLLAEPGDAVGLADVLQRLIEDPLLRERLGRAARQKVAAEFEVDRCAAELAEIFQRYARA